MCGIFAYRDHAGRAPDPELLRTAAEAAGRRGVHGCGWVAAGWAPARGAYATAQYTRTLHLGRMVDHLDEIQALDAPTILGHARLATVGDATALTQLQPVSLSSRDPVIHLAHNGVLREPWGVPDEDAYATDSIALANWYAKLRWSGFTQAEAIKAVAGKANHTAWAIVAIDAGALVVHRRYHPVWTLRLDGAVYLSSQRFHPEATLAQEDTPILL